MARAGHDHGNPDLPQPPPLRRLELEMGDRRRREDAGSAYPRLLRILRERALYRCLWPDRDLRRRHLYGSRPRDRENRIDRTRHCPCRTRDPRRARQSRCARREWRNLPARPQGHARILERPGEDRIRLFRRLVSQRRRRLSRRGRLPLSHGPQEGHDHLRWREYRVLRSRTGDLRTAASSRGRRRRHARPTLGRKAGRDRGAGGWRCAGAF